MTLIDELVREHRTSRDPTQPPRDLTDAFLDEVEKVRCPGPWLSVEDPMNQDPGVGGWLYLPVISHYCWLQAGRPFGGSFPLPQSSPSPHGPGQGEPQEQLQ